MPDLGYVAAGYLTTAAALGGYLLRCATGPGGPGARPPP